LRHTKTGEFLAILGLLAGMSPVMHNFWPSENASERTGNMVHLMKHAALAGGALALRGVEEL
jgi:hypothetical protein